MTACRTSPDAELVDAPTVAVPAGRHARGTWTPQVVPGSGGRRYLADDHVPALGHGAAEPATVAVASSAVAIQPLGIRRVGRTPIRYAPVPGAPRRTSPAVWGPPRPAGA